MIKTCNKCGMDVPKDEAVDYKASGGYNSFHLFDCTTYSFVLCEKCLRLLFNEFIIPPSITDYMDGSSYTYAKDLKMYEDRLWKKAGGEAEKFKKGICNYNKECSNKAVWRQFLSGEIVNIICCDAHKSKWDNCTNSMFINIESIKNISSDHGEQTREQKSLLANLYLKHITKNKIRTLQFLPLSVLDAIGIKQEKTGGFWIPKHKDIPTWCPTNWPIISFEDGTLVFNDAEEVIKIVNNYNIKYAH